MDNIHYCSLLRSMLGSLQEIRLKTNGKRDRLLISNRKEVTFSRYASTWMWVGHTVINIQIIPKSEHVWMLATYPGNKQKFHSPPGRTSRTQQERHTKWKELSETWRARQKTKDLESSFFSQVWKVLRLHGLRCLPSPATTSNHVFSNSPPKAITSDASELSYPDLYLHDSLFSNSSRGFWNRIHFF